MVAMAIRETLWLPVDDLLVVVREFLNPKVSRSGLLRCMARHGLSKRPVEEKGEARKCKTFKDYAPASCTSTSRITPLACRLWGNAVAPHR